MQKYSGVGLFSSIIKCGDVTLGMEPRSGIPMTSTERSFTDAITNMPTAASAKHHTSTRIS